MAKTARPLELLDSMITEAVGEGILHLQVDDIPLDGRTIMVEGRSLVNFGSCSYLGLETDLRLQEGAIAALKRYGMQFSSSRTYASAPGYTELEQLLEAVFDAPTLVTPATTLAHLSTIPVLIGPEDAVILDQQVHHSIQLAVNQVRLAGTRVELIPHSRLDLLQEQIEALRPHVRRIWYMADGVFSMFGDLAPLDALVELQERYEQLHLYLDDAHGMSWAGPHGRGYVLGNIRKRDRLIVTVSLSKAFGAGGGAVILPDREMWRQVKTCGGPMIFTGPIQPPTLGALIASAKIHLSEELAVLQDDLRQRVDLTHRLLLSHGLPVTSASEAPIHFVGMGLPKAAYQMVKRLMAEGLYTNVSMFPAVPMRCAGVRFTSTRHQTFDDIERLVEAIARHFPQVLEEAGSSPDAVFEAFRLSPPLPASTPDLRGGGTIEITVPAERLLRLEHHESIKTIDANEWNSLLGGNGTFTTETLQCLESSFQGHHESENNWLFHYYLVRDHADKPVLATFFTEALWKDDMLSSAAVSRRVERERQKNPAFLTSRTLAMGSLVTDGIHLYLDRSSDWQGAMRLLLRAVGKEHQRLGTQSVVLRDLPADDGEMEAFLKAEGFLRFVELQNMVVDLDWANDEAYLEGLSQKARKHLRKKVLPFDGCYEVGWLGANHRPPTLAELEHVHQLYLNVQQRNLGLNTFSLPPQLLSELATSPAWEFMTIKFKGELGGLSEAPFEGVAICFEGDEHYVPLIVGMDYHYVESHGAYRQLLRNILFRAKALGKRQVHLGYEATFEKTRFGARVVPRVAYLQVVDHYPLELLGKFEADVASERR